MTDDVTKDCELCAQLQRECDAATARYIELVRLRQAAAKRGDADAARALDEPIRVADYLRSEKRQALELHALYVVKSLSGGAQWPQGRV
jgi:hypothetical protein